MKRMRAKLLLAQAHHDIGDEEDVIVIRRGSKGQQCYSTMENAATVLLLSEMGQVICHTLTGRCDA